MPAADANAEFARALRHDVLALLVPLGLAWVIEIADALVFGHGLLRFGILPRDPAGLLGVLSAPLLHAGWPHLLGNTLSYLLFGGMVLFFRDRREFAWVSLAGWLGGGLLTWLIANPFSATGVHVGASGVIFSYFGYLVAIGFYERKFGSVALSLVVALGWGGVVFGVLPGRAGVSWEGHLAGFVVGVGSAWLFARRARARERRG